VSFSKGGGLFFMNKLEDGGLDTIDEEDEGQDVAGITSRP
jgi:hypothetical protein